MFKGLLIAASATLFAIVPMAAQAEGQFFLGASGGPSRTSLKGITGNLSDYADYYGLDSSSSVDKKDSVYSFTTGYRWMVSETFSLGVEAGVVDLGKISGTVTTGYPYEFSEEDRASIRTRGAIAGLNAKWNMTYHWTLGFRGGYLNTSSHSKSSSETTYLYPFYSGHSIGYRHYNTSGNGFYGAAKLGYDFTPFFGIGLGYEYYHTKYAGDLGSSKLNVGVIAASAELRF